MSRYLTLCERAARTGGRQLQDWVGRIEAKEKGPSDLVTQADLASQAAIRELVMAEFPDHGFVAEESAAEATEAKFCWYVDPLDGTTNYVHQFPHYATSIGLARNGQVIAAAIYDPVHDECFLAERGQGAWLNGNPLKTSSVTELRAALLAANFPAQVRVDAAEVLEFLAALQACQSVRRTGSAALNLAYVAAGRLDGFWAHSTYAWDVAAGILLVEEAGGQVSDLQNQRLDLARPHPVATANDELHPKVLALLRQAIGC